MVKLIRFEFGKEWPEPLPRGEKLKLLREDLDKGPVYPTDIHTRPLYRPR